MISYGCLSQSFWTIAAILSVADNAEEENERLELRSRTEVRLTEGETAQESVIYQFTGKTAQE